MATEYKLPFTAKEIDEKLKQIQNGQIGYIEGEVYVPLTTVNATTQTTSNGKVLYRMTISEDELVLFTPEHGEIYEVIVDGIKYKCSTTYIDIENNSGKTRWVLGNRSMVYGYEEDTGEPFAIMLDFEEYLVFFETEGEHTFEIRGKETVYPIDPKYLPENGFGYSEIYETIILPKMTATLSIAGSGNRSVNTHLENSFVPGETYIVKYDGIEYECEAKISDNANQYIGVGNDLYVNSMLPSGLPFYVGYKQNDGHESGSVYLYPDSSPHNISVRLKKETIHTIDKKYIPVMDSLILNGADGKQYKLTVDANGALAVTPML